MFYLFISRCDTKEKEMHGQSEQGRKIINKSAADCPISLIFTTDNDHVTPDVQRTFKVKVSKVELTTSRSG